jgi:ferritin-like metal-binding protein YciE
MSKIFPRGINFFFKRLRHEKNGTIIPHIIYSLISKIFHMKKNGKKTGQAVKHTPATGVENGQSKLNELLHTELKDIYWAEKHLVRAMTKMQKAAHSEELQQAIGDHIEQTKEHVTRLENVFELLGYEPQGEKCHGIEGLTKECERIVEETEEGTATRDVGLILAAQKLEHYEIATYGTLARLARILGKNDVADILDKTLNEEKVTDMNLTQIAEKSVNYASSQELEEA